METNLPAIVVGRLRPEDWAADFAENIPFFEDELTGLGPIGGLRTALVEAGGSVLALPCDMPRLSLRAIAWLVERPAPSDREHGVVTTLNGLFEPLFSIYTAGCLALIEAQVERGDRSLHGLIRAGNFRLKELPERLADDLTNVNTPGDLEGL
jgi:molybdopterin-guanine dinucleotide biosynthesis protein A